ncbi:MAG: helix-turn-helix domain-containing protein [Candidatus Pacearchaeota archaeon]|nr:helix-turn-helix domain-containing protein [Candidatus Pacearchaeota archaeon]
MEKSMSLGERIKYYRKKLGLSQDTLSTRSGISSPSISDYENNKAIPRRQTLEKLAQALNVDIEEFSEEKEPQQELSKEYPGLKNYFDMYSERFIHMSVLGKVHAGNPNEIPEDLIIGGVDLPLSIARGADYVLKVSGMSMKEEGIDENDIVLIRLQKYAENGQIVIARVNDENYVIKRFRQKDGRTWLESANSIYEPITDNFEVVGIIKGLVKKFT